MPINNPDVKGQHLYQLSRTLHAFDNVLGERSFANAPPKKCKLPQRKTTGSVGLVWLTTGGPVDPMLIPRSQFTVMSQGQIGQTNLYLGPRA